MKTFIWSYIVSINVSFSGLLFDGEVTKLTQDAMDDALLYGEMLIREKTPILSGNLANNWGVNDNSIFNNEYYADYVENGTYKMSPRYMVKSSLPAIEEKLLDSLVKVLGS